ncbi:MAG: 50S ribosomal protein L18, partial [Salinivirgaceae bacterium]|nr:50S ribosomal protein L18 [Salinivirgaceae bacterium]
LNIKEIIFDRNRYSYAGRVKALAETARANGLIF